MQLPSEILHFDSQNGDKRNFIYQLLKQSKDNGFLFRNLMKWFHLYYLDWGTRIKDRCKHIANFILYLTRMFSMVYLVDLNKVLSQICNSYTYHCKAILRITTHTSSLYSLIYAYMARFWNRIKCFQNRVEKPDIVICACLQTNS